MKAGSQGCDARKIYGYTYSRARDGNLIVTALRTSAILKTDIKGSTPSFRALPESDLSRLLTSHREFITKIAAEHGGRIVKPEGDGFWILFPSVTAAALAAMTMQEELQLAQPNKGDDRLAMRIVITLGDVLNPEGALIGDAVVLAARIEAVTPADEIYLSAAARLAVNPAEVRTALVDSFTLKGFPEPVAVYRVEHRHRTQEIKDQYIVLADLCKFSATLDTSPVSAIEKTLDRLQEIVGAACRKFGGVGRFNLGDSYLMTFAEADSAVAAAQRLYAEWSSFERETNNCAMRVMVHKGTFFIYRTFAYGNGLNQVFAAERATRGVDPSGTGVFVTGDIVRALAGTKWAGQLKHSNIAGGAKALAGIEFYRLETPG